MDTPRKRALITGITGQDGSYLAEFLLSKGYDVAGIVRRSSSIERERIDHLHLMANETDKQRVELIYGDLSDGSSLNRALRQWKPDEVYNLGAQSHVRVSFDVPEYTADVDGVGVVRLLEAIRDVGIAPRFYQASTSELYGGALPQALDERTPFNPRSPYACAKALGFFITKNYREAYGMYAVNGILFNHESPRRSPNFVTRKVSRAAARIKLGLQKNVALGNLDARRDWGFAGDYVEAMWSMLQAARPDDYVIATGETRSVRELLDAAFSHVGLQWQDYVVHDDRHLRPTEVDVLLGDASKAKRELGWEPKVRFGALVKMMVDADLARERAQATIAAGPST
jgi:GDPmannose 4,6-dehydratase